MKVYIHNNQQASALFTPNVIRVTIFSEMTLLRTIQQHKITLLSGLGAGLEYYDFVIYVIFSHYLSIVLFPPNTGASSLITVLSIFSAGYLIRPIGGIFFASLGDRFGRKNIFILSISLMAISTIGIGLIPSYATIGLCAPAFLLLCRLIQGLSLGAEMPGAITFLMEHVGKDYRGTHSGFMFMNIGIGAMLSTFIGYILTSTLTIEQMTSWGFRFPFLLGGIIAVVCFYLRRRALETPLFSKENTTRYPFITLVTQYRKKIVMGICLTIFAACFIIFALYLPTYIHRNFHYPMHLTYLASTISLLWSAICIPFFGWVSDKLGRKILLYMSSLMVVFVSYALFYLVKSEITFLLFVFMFLYQTIVSIFSACYPPMLAELFPTKVRYSGIALCYNVAFSLGSFTPLVVTFWVERTGDPLLVGLIFSLLAIVTLIAAVLFDDRTQRQLQEE